MCSANRWKWVGVVALSLGACGGGETNEGGRFVSGNVARQSARAGAAHFGDPAQADAIWVIPVNEGSVDTSGFRERIELPIAADGSFLYSEEMGGYQNDVLLALVNSSACANSKPRGDWQESDLDERLNCIQGFVSIDDAADSGALTLIPLGDQESGLELESIEGSEGGEALSTTSLEDASSSFGLDLETLRSIARTDERLKAFAYLYANFDDDAVDNYSMHLLYDWEAPLSQATNGETNPSALTTPGYMVNFDTTVDTTGVPLFQSGYLRLYPPASVIIEGIPTPFGPSTPLLSAEAGFSYEVNQGGRLAGSAGLFSGVSPAGEWKLQRYGVDGPVVAKFDLALVSPFSLVDGQPNLAQPTTMIPTLVVDAVGDEVQSITWSLKIHDGNTFVEVPSDVALRMIGSPRLGISSDESAGCPGEEQRLEGVTTTTWTPTQTYVLGASTGSTCRVNQVFFAYFSMGTLYQFFWTNEAT